MSTKGEKETPIIISLKDNNQRLFALVHNLVFHLKMKHIDIQYHYIRNKAAFNKIELLYVPTD